ncbi:MAG TPA: amidohydrolase [Acidobacteria bacterium]|nr:amidohydrolase [Acidobacteriota bacterium]
MKSGFNSEKFGSGKIEIKVRTRERRRGEEMRKAKRLITGLLRVGLNPTAGANAAATAVAGALFFCFLLMNAAAGLARPGALAASSGDSPPRVLVIKAAKILTMAGPALENGMIIIEDGKIKQVGTNLTLPQGAEIIEEPEGWVLPGLIDAHSSLGLVDETGRSENEELSEPNVAQLSVIDGLNPFDKRIVQARAAGITAALVTPGRRSVIGGQMAAVRLRGKTVEEMVLLSPAGVKFSIGEGPKQAFGEKGRLPSTRMGNVYVIRQALLEAREYAEKWSAYEKKLAEARKARKDAADIQAPKRDLRLEALARVMRGELTAFIECYRVDDISAALRLVDEFRLKAVLVGCAEGYLLAEEIARRKIPVIVGPFGIGPKRTETERVATTNAARLQAAGVKVVLQSEVQYGLGTLEELPLVAALAVRGGLPEEEALKAITINAAEVMGVAGKIGSLEPGKEADLVIFSGHPLDYRSRVKRVLIGGE